METTNSDNNAFTPAGTDAMQRWRSATGREVSDLMADVQDLLGQVASVADPNIARLRAKVEGAMASVRSAVSDSTDRVQEQARDVLRTGDRYVHEQPWQAIGLAAAAGLIVGFLVARR